MILNYSVKKADYIEADAAVIEIINRNAKRFGHSFNDKRVLVNNLNARDFLARQNEKYDLILIGFGLPANLRANGFYAKEFFQKAKNNLKPDGFLALKLPGKMVYSSYIMAELNACVSKTLKSVFKNVKIIPGEQNILIASDAKMPFRFEIKKRLAGVQETVLVLSKYYLDDRMDTQKTKWLAAELKKARGKVSVNSDLNPQGFINSVLYLQAGFSPRLSVFLDKTLRYSYLFALAAALLLFQKSMRKTTAFSSGAACLWMFLIVLFYFRIINGQIFKLGAIFSACFVLGISAACLFNNKFKRVTSLNKKIFNCELAFALLAVFLYCAFKFFDLKTFPASLFIFALGFAGGFEFLKLYEIPALLGNDKEKSASGGVMPAYIFGAALACLLGGGFLIFAWGFERSLLFVLFFKFLTFCRWADISKRGL
jgi:spermidine synthase